MDTTDLAGPVANVRVAPADQSKMETHDPVLVQVLSKRSEHRQETVGIRGNPAWRKTP